MSIKAKVITQNTINAQVNPGKKIIPKQVTTGGQNAINAQVKAYKKIIPKQVFNGVVPLDDGNQTISGTKTFTDTGLNQLNDVAISSVGASDLIIFDSTISKFTNTNIMDGGNF